MDDISLPHCERNFQRNFIIFVLSFLFIYLFILPFPRIFLVFRVGRNTNTLRIPVFLEQFIYALRLFIYPSIRFKDGGMVIKIIYSYVCCGCRDNRYRNSRNDIVFFRLIDILLYYSCLGPRTPLGEVNWNRE